MTFQQRYYSPAPHKVDQSEELVLHPGRFSGGTYITLYENLVIYDCFAREEGTHDILPFLRFWIFLVSKCCMILAKTLIERRLLIPAVIKIINFVISSRVGEGELRTCQNAIAR
jgi:hypothetical protein